MERGGFSCELFLTRVINRRGKIDTSRGALAIIQCPVFRSAGLISGRLGAISGTARHMCRPVLKKKRTISGDKHLELGRKASELGGRAKPAGVPTFHRTSKDRRVAGADIRMSRISRNKLGADDFYHRINRSLFIRVVYAT